LYVLFLITKFCRKEFILGENSFKYLLLKRLNKVSYGN